MNKLVVALLLALALLIGVSLPRSIVSATGGITLVQKSFSIKGWASNNSTTLTTTAGNTLIVAVTQYSNTISSLTDTEGDTFVLIDSRQAASGMDYVNLYYAKNIHGGATTVNLTLSSASDNNLGVYEYSGIDTVTPFDIKTSAIGNNANPNGGNLVTTTDGELYFVLGTDDNNSVAATPGSGYVLLDHQDDSGAHERYYIEAQVSNHGTYATNFTLAHGSAWAVIGVTFKPASSAPTDTPTSTSTQTPTPTGIPTATPTPTNTPTPTPISGAPAHTVIVIEENKSLQQVLGVGYFTQLASQGALMAQSFAITHPSEPNYLALFSGSTQGTTNDDCPMDGSPYIANNLGKQLLDNGLTFAGYSESLPHSGQFSCDSGDFTGHHDPWEAFSNVPIATNLAFSNFPSDYSQLPTVSFVVPNNNHNAHDGTIQQASTWLQANIDGYTQWAQTHNSLLIVTFDEDDNTNGGNLIYTVFIGPMIKTGIYNETINHYNMLSTVEHLYGLPQIASASPVIDIFK